MNPLNYKSPAQESPAAPARSKQSTIIIALLIVIAGASLLNVVLPQRLPSPGQWEYRTVNTQFGKDLTEMEMRRLGLDGWEITGVQENTVYMKRRLR